MVIYTSVGTNRPEALLTDHPPTISLLQKRPSPFSLLTIEYISDFYFLYIYRFEIHPLCNYISIPPTFTEQCSTTSTPPDLDLDLADRLVNRDLSIHQHLLVINIINIINSLNDVWASSDKQSTRWGGGPVGY